MHSIKDDVVNPVDAVRLFRKAGEPKRLAFIEGAGHHLRLDDRAMAEVAAWLCSFAGTGLPCSYT